MKQIFLSHIINLNVNISTAHDWDCEPKLAPNLKHLFNKAVICALT